MIVAALLFVTTTSIAPPAPQPGPAVRPEEFAHRRTIPRAAAGWVSLQLDPSAVSGEHGLDALRIIDATNHQLPYVVENRRETLLVPLTPLKRQKDGRQGSLYAFPISGTPASLLELSSDEPRFERSLTVELVSRAEFREVTSSWTGTAHPKAMLRIELPPTEAHELRVKINEGDNAPLPLSSIALRTPSIALRFYHPGAEGLSLLYGNELIAAPRYDLALNAKSILALDVPTLHAEPEHRTAPPPAAAPTGRAGGNLFVIALGIVALLLIVLLGRLLR